MYEPKHVPVTNEEASLPSIISFGISHKNNFLQLEDPDLDPPHVHKYIEIFFNISSDVSFLVNNKIYPVEAREAIVSLPGDVHVCMFNKAAVHEHICLWIDADIGEEIFSFMRRDDFCPLFAFGGDTGREVEEKLFGLISLCQGKASMLEKTSLLLQILAIFEKQTPPSEKRIAIPRALQEILDDMHTSFSEIHGINDILNKHFVSSATLTRWFRRYIGLSPREYLESVRLSNAVSMLDKGASVMDACIGSGFSDCSHFIVLFKKKFGVTPHRYKKNGIAVL